MESSANLISRRAVLRDDHAIVFDHTCDDGYLLAHYRPKTDTYAIDDFEVSLGQRRKGVGAQLLKSAKMTAESIGASRVTATIISKECLSAMSRVFGAQNISVRREGEFAPVGRDSHPDLPTSAHLDYAIVSRPQEQ